MAKKRTASDTLNDLNFHLQKLVDDQTLTDNPFDVDFYESNEFKSKSSVDRVIHAIYEYFKIEEKWHKDAKGLDLVRVAFSIFGATKKTGTYPTATTLKGVGGLINTDWLVFVPFSKVSHSFAPSAKIKPVKIAESAWIMSINEAKDHVDWAKKRHGKNTPIRRIITKPSDQRSIFFHQMCQIDGGDYKKQKLMRGVFFVFRFRGTLRDLDASTDISKLFVLMMRGMVSIGSKGTNGVDHVLSSAADLHPCGIVGFNMKTYSSERFRRNTVKALNILVTEDKIKKLKENSFSSILKNIFSLNTTQYIWGQLKTASDLLYQSLENEELEGNGLVQGTVTTILLCSAGEAMLNLSQGDKKRKLSTLIALILYPNSEKDFKECQDFLSTAYSKRSNFVHDGVIEEVDNQKLFFYIYNAWLNLAKHFSNSSFKEGNYVNEYARKKLNKNSPIYKSYFETEFKLK